MPRIFDNIEQALLPALQETLDRSDRADFCVGYFNLRGWKQLDTYVEKWAGGDGHCCRLMVGMQRPPEEELHEIVSLIRRDKEMDQPTAVRLRRKLALEFREQLAWGVPTDEDETGLRRLASQIRARKVVVKLFLRHPLHAKLYLLFRPDPIAPSVGYLGSSNLTMSGLSRQGELNIDVLDHDACAKLARWFEGLWNDRWCLDISDELVRIIEESWARVEPLPPYYIYVKMAYHLSNEARAGLNEFKIPRDFGNKLFQFQAAAVKIAAHHLNKRGGVLIGDVVGLGKTLMATAVARIFEDDHGLETLILCPKNLVPMWEDYRSEYRMRARVLSITQAIRDLHQLRRYRLIIIDESHNLRNREGKRYKAIQDYIRSNDSKVILLSATPYNKSYLDLANQLRLFVEEDINLGIRPEALIRELGETEFIRRHQASPHSIAAFEKSFHADDWRELMRLYMVRRTRGFIQENYADTDPATGRKYLQLEDGTRSFFPERKPRTVKFKIDERNADDPYARLYADDVVAVINGLRLPRYGLGNYLGPTPDQPPTAAEARQLEDLSRAGKRLMGFSRTNLFKRLESSGHAFLLSIERHILRNFIYLHAIEHGLALPIGTQDSAILDAATNDGDENAQLLPDEDTDNGDEQEPGLPGAGLHTEAEFQRRATEIYGTYTTVGRRRFKWLSPRFFAPALAEHLLDDARALIGVLARCGDWNPEKDAKLAALFDLIEKKHRNQKVLIFTQFADTADYINAQCGVRKLSAVACATGDVENPTALAWRFSPVSNGKTEQMPGDELRVLIATDVLSEGQNLQDCAVIVNFDLPWAIIRLIQRAGRVDRIGQQAEVILCYSFLPAEGVERIIRLRSRVRARLRENAEVIGTDEAFFEDENEAQSLRDLFTEKSGILDGDDETEVDLASYAYQIWKNAIDRDEELQKIIPDLPPVSYSTKAIPKAANGRQGVLIYLRTPDGNDALAWMADDGTAITESQFAILRAAACEPSEPALPRLPSHHQLLRKGVELVLSEERSVGGQLGSPKGARFRTYERLKRYADEVKGTLFESQELIKAIDDIYRHPLRQTAVDTLNRQLRSGISDDALAQLVVAVREEGRLCVIHEEEEMQEPRIICSLGLAGKAG
ncbi:MAG: NgoFVII family restriction endonuclease [Acidobacteria bacterium RIFCSPLOWO2_02_FULL_65_29]|nr:MAG: NgoFVII family restriction endonuclease [Acidobacteria bacterium RIFCSPLOWO2_02_FULL_65_29]